MLLKFTTKKTTQILALGAESAGNFSFFHNGQIYFSKDFGDLLEEKNWKKFQKSVLAYLRENKIKPSVILSDLHPLFKTTFWGKKLAKKFNAKFIQVQHHHAHIFSAVGDKIIQDTRYKIQDTIYGITMDGTGFGKDEKIWGGEVFEIKGQETRNKEQKIQRIGHLENQILLGGEAAIREPARMLIAILAKIKSHPSADEAGKLKVKNETRNLKLEKDFIFKQIKKYYTRNEFELLYNQLQQNFNCTETSSAGRILDAMSLLLGFCKNERKYKHEPISLLEAGSTNPYLNIKPKIIFDKKEKKYILNTTYLFNYVISALSGSAFGGNCPRHKKKNLSAEEAGRLAATTQLYIAQGLYEITKKIQETRDKRQFDIFISGGIANNKIISSFFENKKIHTNKKIPCGDAGLSFGQIVYYLLKI